MLHMQVNVLAKNRKLEKLEKIETTARELRNLVQSLDWGMPFEIDFVERNEAETEKE